MLVAPPAEAKIAHSAASIAEDVGQAVARVSDREPETSATGEAGTGKAAPVAPVGAAEAEEGAEAEAKGEGEPGRFKTDAAIAQEKCFSESFGKERKLKGVAAFLRRRGGDGYGYDLVGSVAAVAGACEHPR